MSNYRVVVHYDPDRSVFVARAPELEHCSAEGPTRAEAMAKIEEEIGAQVANMREHGNAPPPVLDEDSGFAGELSAKVSRSLHRDLAWQARLEGVELSQLVGEMLAVGLEARRGRRRPAPNANAQPQQGMPRDDEGAGPPRRDDRQPRGPDRRGYAGGGGGRYHAIMEDRATFLEYVRGLESGAAPGPGGGRGPRRGGRGGGGGRGPGGRGQGEGGGTPPSEGET